MSWDTMSFREKRNLFILMGVSLFLIISFGIGAYIVQKDHRENRILEFRLARLNIQKDNATPSSEPKPYTFKEFLLGDNFTSKTFFLGLVAGVIFGFIDNAGLWFGMASLDPLFSSYDELTKAGIGNTFSDALGTFLSTFIAIILFRLLKHDEEIPLVSEFLGIIIGCLLGIVIPKYISNNLL